MKKIKLFILISVGFLLGAIVATGVVWYHLVIKPLQEVALPVPIDTVSEQVETVKEKGSAVVEDVAEAIATPTEEELAEVSDESIVVSVDALPESQQKVLQTLGINGTQYEITPEMQQCAEAKLGKERLDEIVAGAAPGMLEAASLLSCL